MLNSIEIQRYKAFSRLSIPHLSRLTVIGGKNNTGKSSLLEALFLFCDRSRPDMLLRALAWRGIAVIPNRADKIFAHSFHNYDLTLPIELRAASESALQRLSFRFLSDDSPTPVSLGERNWSEGLSAKHPLSRATDAPMSVRVEVFDLNHSRASPVEEAALEVSDGELRMNKKFSRRGIPTAKYIGPNAASTPQEDAIQLGSMEVDRESEPLLQFVQQFFPEVRSLATIPTGPLPMIYADVGLTKQIPLPALGDGVSRLVSYYLSGWTVKRGGLLLLDEVGAGIHYSLLPTLWRGLRAIAENFGCQIIATTHSRECLAAAAEALSEELAPPDFSYIRLDRNSSGESVSVQYDFSEFVAAIKSHWEIR